ILILTGVNEDSCSLKTERKCSSLPNSPAKCVSLTKKKQFFINQTICNSDLTPRAKGKKNQRRQENSCYLANRLDRNECSKDEAEVCTLLVEQEKLQALLEEAKRNNCNKLLKDQREGESPGHFYFPRSHWFRVHLRYLEENILSFFGAQPHSVYATNLGSRLDLHRYSVLVIKWTWSFTKYGCLLYITPTLSQHNCNGFLWVK
uniref:R3H-associated N-terminal domain-containing protein n=1 Tax=Oncorhynchus mykiss TaxID=8022 RepID=A0A8C7NE53_ONCMY